MSKHTTAGSNSKQADEVDRQASKFIGRSSLPNEKKHVRAWYATSARILWSPICKVHDQHLWPSSRVFAAFCQPMEDFDIPPEGLPTESQVLENFPCE
jgi:hypothetical protein